MFYELFFLWSILISGIVLVMMGLVFGSFLLAVSFEIDVKIGKVITAIFGTLILIMSSAMIAELLELVEQMKNIA